MGLQALHIGTAWFVVSLMVCFSELLVSYLSLSHSSVSGRFHPTHLCLVLQPSDFSTHPLLWLKGEGCQKQALWARFCLSTMLLKPNLLTVCLGRSEKLNQMRNIIKEKGAGPGTGSPGLGKQERAGGPSISTWWSDMGPPCLSSPAVLSLLMDKLRLKRGNSLREGGWMVLSHSPCSSRLRSGPQPCMWERLMGWLIQSTLDIVKQTPPPKKRYFWFVQLSKIPEGKKSCSCYHHKNDCQGSCQRNAVRTAPLVDMTRLA